jgi:ribonuclease Z
MHAEGRGGSAYAVWLSGRPVFVVDMGADTPTALARAGAVPTSVDVLLVSHLHADHVSGIPDFLWGEATAVRSAPLVVAGPDGATTFPGIAPFIERLIGPEGAFPRMSGIRTGTPFSLRLLTLAAADREPQAVLDHAGVHVTALSVPHGPAPALAYRLDGPAFSVVLAGDQSGDETRLAEFAANTDVLVLHALLTDDARDHPLSRIVATPERLGALAQASRAKRVVLSHLMGQPQGSEQARRWSLTNIEGVLQSIRREYRGPVELAVDLLCVGL